MNRYIIFFKLIISFIFVVVVCQKFDLNDMLIFFSKIKFYTIVSSIGFAIIIIIFNMFRWYVIIRQVVVSIPIQLILKIFLVGTFFNQFLPSTIGGDAYRIIYLSKSGVSVAHSTVSVAIDRLIGLLTFILLAEFAHNYIGPIIEIDKYFNILNTTIISFLIMVTAIFIYMNVGKNKIFQIENFLEKYDFNFNLINITAAILCSIISALSVIYFLFLISTDLEMNIDFTVLLLTVPLVNLVIAIPISFAGWGIRESAMIFILGYFNVAASLASFLGLSLGLLSLTTAVPGLYFLWKPKVTEKY